MGGVQKLCACRMRCAASHHKEFWVACSCDALVLLGQEGARVCHCAHAAPPNSGRLQQPSIADALCRCRSFAWVQHH